MEAEGAARRRTRLHGREPLPSMVLFSLKISKNAAVLNPQVDAGIDPYEPLDIGYPANFIRQIFNGRK